MLPNCPQYIISYYGILKAGAVVTQVNPMYLEKELLYILNDSGAKTIVVYEPLYPRIKAIADKTLLEKIIVVSFEPEKSTLQGRMNCLNSSLKRHWQSHTSCRNRSTGGCSSTAIYGRYNWRVKRGNADTSEYCCECAAVP